MRDLDEFDSFYADARDRLLLQTYALTGDLTASRTAVRDAFVAAWHHWRKVSRLDDPEAWTRPIAWRHAQRRHISWRRDRDPHLGEGAAATLEALAGLSTVERKALVLDQLADVLRWELAREVGLTDALAAGTVGAATGRFAGLRDIPVDQVREALAELEAPLAEVRWPRAPIIRRTGAARRRTHTTVGVIGTVVALVVSGAAVSQGADVRATLDRDQRGPAATGSPSDQGGVTETPQDPDRVLSADSLLGTAEVSAALDGRGWQAGDAHANTSGNGLVLPCQTQRYADPEGAAALVRSLESGGRKGAAPTSVTQLAEVSVDRAAARGAYDVAVGWFAGCAEQRVQLVSTRAVGGVGDRAVLLTFRDWQRRGAAVAVGVARTGRLTTTVVTRSPAPLDPPRTLRLLATAVRGLCDLDGAAACVSRPTARPAPPPPTGAEPAMLSVLDLPPVAGVAQPWVGTDPVRARSNVAATRCDRTELDGKGISHNLTRTFLIPGADLPAQFGLTETVAVLPLARARALVRTVRARLAECSDEQLGTDVVRVRDVATPQRDLSVWNVTVEISDQASVRFLMAFVRHGRAVGQLGFVPAAGVTIGDDDFVALAQRALDRLVRLPRSR